MRRVWWIVLGIGCLAGLAAGLSEGLNNPQTTVGATVREGILWAVIVGLIGLPIGLIMAAVLSRSTVPPVSALLVDQSERRADAKPGVLVWVRRVLTAVAFAGVITVPMRFSGCVGPMLLPKGHIDHGHIQTGGCAYHTCPQAATGRPTVKVLEGTENVPIGPVTYYTEPELPLCDYHAGCARRERWPESGPAAAWFHAAALGVIGGVFLAVVADSLLRKLPLC